MLNTKQLWGNAEGQEWKGNSRGSAIHSLHAAGGTQTCEIQNLLLSILFI